MDIPQNALEATREYVSPEQAMLHSVEGMIIRKVLQRVDPRLDVILVKPGSDTFGTMDQPRWFITRRNEGTVDSYWMIEDENENYCPPTMAHVEKFRKGDTAANPDLWKEFERTRVSRKAAADRELRDKGEEFREKLLERLGHIHDGQISMHGSDGSKLWVP